MANNRNRKAATAEVIDSSASTGVEEIPAAPESGPDLAGALSFLTGGNDGTKRTRTSPRLKAYNASLAVIVSYQEHHAENEEIAEVLAKLRGEVEALRDASPDGDDEESSHIRGRAPTVHVVCGKEDGTLHHVPLVGKAPNRDNIPSEYVSCYGPFRNAKTAASVVEKGITGREAFRLF